MQVSRGISARVFSVFLFALASGGCGGGGGSSSGSTSTVITASAPVTVTTANAPAVAGATLDVAGDTTGGGGGVAGVLAASVGGAPAADINILDALMIHIRQTPGLSGNSRSRLAPAAVVPVSNQPCDSGSFSGTFNDADNDSALTTGDTLSITASNCTFDGVTLHGSLSVDSVIVTGGYNSEPPVPPYSVSVRLQANNLSVTEAGERVVITGTFSFAESTTDGTRFASSFTGSAVQFVTATDTLVLTDFEVIENTDDATGAYTTRINGTLSSDGVGGSVQVTTVTDFTGTGLNDPVAGEAVCVGAGNTSVRLIANADGTTVDLQVDTDGDGTADNLFTANWADL